MRSEGCVRIRPTVVRFIGSKDCYNDVRNLPTFHIRSLIIRLLLKFRVTIDEEARFVSYILVTCCILYLQYFNLSPPFNGSVQMRLIRREDTRLRRLAHLTQLMRALRIIHEPAGGFGTAQVIIERPCIISRHVGKTWINREFTKTGLC